MDIPGLCYLVSVIASVGLIVWGLFDILKQKEKHETDFQVVQRQIRGFGYLILSEVVLIIGVVLCSMMKNVKFNF